MSKLQSRWEQCVAESVYNGKISYQARKREMIGDLVIDSCQRTFSTKEEGALWLDELEKDPSIAIWASRKIGLVYCIQAVNDTSTVGKSEIGDAFKARVKKHDRGSPIEFCTCGVFQCVNPSLIETQVHRMLSHFRLENKKSWYNATFDSIVSITGIPFTEVFPFPGRSSEVSPDPQEKPEPPPTFHAFE